MPRRRREIQFQIAAPTAGSRRRSFLALLGRRLTPSVRLRLQGISLADAGIPAAVRAAVAPLAIGSMLGVAMAWPWQIDRMVAAGISRPRLAAVLLAAVEGDIVRDPRVSAGREMVPELAEAIGGASMKRTASMQAVRHDRPPRPRAKRTRATADPGAPASRVAQLRITLLGIDPPIWRRVQVPVSITLRRLHDVLQVAMGWRDAHLHQFTSGGRTYGMTEPEAEPQADTLDDRAATLEDVAPAPGTSIAYEYDFGDGWEHEIVVEDLRPSGVAARRALCLDGARACPPEDCGGPHTYSEDLLPALRAVRPTGRQRELLEWVSDPAFDPEAFDLDAVNRRLRRLKL